MKSNMALFTLAIVVLVAIMPIVAVANQNSQPWNTLAFDEQSRAWDANRMKLVMENNGTMTAYILVRDIYVDLTGAIERASWKGHPQAEIAFNGLVQTRGLSTTEFIQRIFSYDNVPNQLAGIFFASDATGWELSKLKDHDSLYNQEIHFRIVNAGTDYQREEVMFVLRGIPLCCDLVHGQFIFLYPGNPDGTTDHVWLNPGWMDPRDHTQYWVPDCQDVDAEGEIINGHFVRNVFVSENVPCAW